MLAILTSRRTGEVQLFDVPEPELNPHGILVRTHFSAISAGTERATMDLSSKSLLSKAMARPDLVRQVVDYARQNGIQAAYQKVTSKLDTLSTMGYSCAGEVIAVGAEAGEFKVGDRVACAGVGFANHCEVNYVPRNLAVHIPDGVETDAAALTTIGAIAMQGLRQANIAFGETVAIVGAGLLGALAIQITRAAGCRVVAIDLSPERVKQAARFGAHLSLLANDPDLVEKVHAFSRYGVDAAVLTASSSSAEPVEMAAKLMRDRGRIVMVGAIGLGVSREKMYMKELSLTLSRSYGPGRYDPKYEEEGNDYPIGYVRWTERRNMEAFLDLVANKQIDVAPLLQARYSVEHAANAYANLTSGIYTAIIEYPTMPLAKSVERVAVQRTLPKDEVRIGCIGAGSFSTGVMFPAMQAVKGARFEAVATASGVGAASAQKAFHFNRAETPAELLTDPNVDAVFVFSRHDSHADYVIRAIQNGKAVFVEKPLATTPEELQEIEAAVAMRQANAENAFVMVGFNRRFAPYTEKIREFFAGRAEAMMLNIRINAGFIPPDHWAHQHGGRIVGEFCHFVDWARAVVGSPIMRVSADWLPNGQRYCNDNVTATLSFADGSVATVQYLANGDKSVAKEFYEVFCAGGVARLNNFTSLELVRGGRKQMLKGNSDKGHRREMELTLNSIRMGQQAPIPLSELIEVTRTTFLVQESARLLRPIMMQEEVGVVPA
ncbi:MAG TPA: bi-domain-containing oxidoreductase [Terracidiphilus sp.]|nr:bi-domain-containing oxidoreductase [Terracidiphilus sp.]